MLHKSSAWIVTCPLVYIIRTGNSNRIESEKNPYCDS